jgi:hypothetical protein
MTMTDALSDDTAGNGQGSLAVTNSTSDMVTNLTYPLSSMRQVTISPQYVSFLILLPPHFIPLERRI